MCKLGLHRAGSTNTSLGWVVFLRHIPTLVLSQVRENGQGRGSFSGVEDPLPAREI